MKQISMDFNKRQYMRPVDFELFYYNDTQLRSVAPHHHDYCEFYFFLEGNVKYHIGNAVYRLSYGDCLLIPPETPHFPEFLSFDQPYRRFVFWLNKSYYEKLHKQDPQLTYCFDTAASSQVYRISADRITAQDIQGKLLDLLEENSSERIFHAQASGLMAISFLVYINRLLYSSLHEHSQVLENTLYLKICDYIRLNLEDNLSLEQIAANFYVSKYHIALIFKDNFSASVYIVETAPCQPAGYPLRRTDQPHFSTIWL